MSDEPGHLDTPPQPPRTLGGRGKFIGAAAPDHKLPDDPIDPADAPLLIEEELLLDGDPDRNLATIVTTWMGPDVTELIGQNLYRNFIDHAEYPQTAEIEQPCIRRQAQPDLRRRRPRRLGEVLPLLRHRATDRSPAGGQAGDRA